MADKTYRERVEDLKCLDHGRTWVLIWDARDLASEADAELAACRLRIAELEKDADSVMRKVKSALFETPDAHLISRDILVHNIGSALNSKKESE